MARYRKKPVVIEAIRITFAEWDGRGWDSPPLSEEPEWLGNDAILLCIDGEGRYLGWSIKTLEGEMMASPGDYIIRGIKGELYPCKPDIFQQTYEPV